MEKKLLSSRIVNALLIAFAAVWVLFITLDYFNKHSAYYLSFEYFKYPKLLIFILATIGVLIWHYKFDKKSSWKIPVTGLNITILGFVFSASIGLAHKDFGLTPTSFSQIFYHLKEIWLVIGILFVMVMIFRSFGQYVFRKVFKGLIPASLSLNIALGLIFFVLALFIIGSFKSLSPNAVIALLFIFAVLNLMDLVKSIRQFFFHRLLDSEFTVLGIFSFLFLLFFLLLNFQTAIGPFPSGFDSRNFYVNISKLMADAGGLLEGYQPYNWSVLMSVGFLLFNKVELALGLSFLPLILVLIATYEFAKRILNFDSNISMFLFCLFVVTPAIANQMYIELKVDFGMLFFQMVALFYTILLLKKLESMNENASFNAVIKKMLPMVAIIGVLSGFALGIKMVNMFMVFSILILIWWEPKNKIGVFGILCFSLTLFLVAGIDEISGLATYHLSLGIVKWVLLVLSVLSLIYSFVKHRRSTVMRLVISVTFLMFSGLMIVPWIIKNYEEIESFEPKHLLMGKDPGPNINPQKMISKFEATKSK